MTSFRRLQPRHRLDGEEVGPTTNYEGYGRYNAGCKTLEVCNYSWSANLGYPRNPRDSVLLGPLYIVELTELPELHDGDSKKFALVISRHTTTCEDI